MNIKITVKPGKSIAIAFALLFIVCLGIMLTIATRGAQVRENLAAWQPAAKPADLISHSPTDSSEANKAASLTRSGGETVVLGGTGGTTKEDPKGSYYSRGWNSEDQWWQVSGVSTSGYEGIELSFATRGSDTGPKNFSVEYSADGETWQPLRDAKNMAIAYSVEADNRFYRHGPYRLAPEMNGYGSLFIRFVNIGAESVIGAATQSSGTNYLTDISITGIAIKE